MDPEGNLKEKLILDRGINSFCLSEECSVIYGGREEEILKFEFR